MPARWPRPQRRKSRAASCCPAAAPAAVRVEVRPSCSSRRELRPTAAPILAPRRKPLNQRLRQRRGAHARLHRSNVIRNAPKLNRVMLEIGNGETGTRIAIAGLAHRPRIEQIAAVRLHAQRRERLRCSRVYVQNLEIRLLIGKSALMMRVAEER